MAEITAARMQMSGITGIPGDYASRRAAPGDIPRISAMITTGIARFVQRESVGCERM
jgi:hypothetical protein